MRPPVYLDYNATAPIRPEARAAAVCALDIGANPSSVHATGRAARASVETARAQVAALVAAAPDQLTFTSGGTEANALAVGGLAAAGGVERLIVGATEHDSVIAAARATGLPVEVWPVDRRGVADLDWLRDRLAGIGERTLVCLMLANNETGVVQPVAEVADLVHAAGGLLHVDAVQAPGRVVLDLEGLGADALTLSAHKLGGPQGVGALALGAGVRLSPRLHGGGQERGLRAGTENVSGIAGFGAAAEAALSVFLVVRHAEERSSERVSKHAPEAPRVVRDAAHAAPHHDEGGSGGAEKAAARLAAAGAVIAGEGAPRLPGVLCTATDGWRSDLQVMALDLEGVRVSAGAACSSGKVKPSGVLTAMGYGSLADGALRASGGWATTAQDWDRFADAWLEAHARHAARRRVKEFA